MDTNSEEERKFRRLNINIRDSTAGELLMLRDIQDTTITNVVRRAVEVYHQLVLDQQSGKQIQIYDPAVGITTTVRLS